MRLEANPDERRALAALCNLPDVARLSAALHLAPKPGGAVKVDGRVTADVTQVCTVSLDPFEASVDEPVDVLFMPEDGIESWMNKHRVQSRDEPTLADEDPPDAIVNGRIDLGQLAAEYLSLGLDPYPRKPGVAFEADDQAADRDASPFAALGRLKPAP